MRATQTHCPRCGADLLVDTDLFRIGTIRLRCGQCSHYFHPATAADETDIQSVANANVPIELWEPASANDAHGATAPTQG
jgi:predicted Zn finger-like uncharacterized protein